MRLTSWPRALSSLKTSSGIVASRFSLLKPASCGQNEPWKCSVWKRGHSSALWTFGIPAIPELDDVEERLQDRLVLVVAAGRAQRHQRLAVLEHQARRQRVARPRPRPDLVGAGLVEPELLAAHAHADAGVAEDHRAGHPAAARRGVEDVAGLVDDRPCGWCPSTRPPSRVRATVSLAACASRSPAGALRRCRRRCCTCANGQVLTFESCGQRIAGDERPRRLPRVDQRRALLRIGLRQQAFARHLHERRVGVVGVAVGVGQLHRLGDGVHVVGAVVAHRRQVERLEDVERLQQHRPLAREAVLVDGVAAIGRGRRLLDAGEVLGEVAERRTAPGASAGTPPSPWRCRPCRSDRARRRCAAARPLPLAARSASTIRVSVRARVGSLMVSPALCGVPSAFSQ